MLDECYACFIRKCLAFRFGKDLLAMKPSITTHNTYLKQIM